MAWPGILRDEERVDQMIRGVFCELSHTSEGKKQSNLHQE